MKEFDLYDRFKSAVDSEINGWRVADRLSVLEQRERAQNMIYGIVKAGLYVLSEESYHKLVAYVHENGFNH